MITTFTGNEHVRDSDSKLIYGLIITQGLKSQAISVTSAVKLPTSPYSKRKFVLIQNLGTGLLYIGASDVTTSNGYEILPKGSILIYIEDGIDIYGVSNGTADTRVFEGA